MDDWGLLPQVDQGIISRTTVNKQFSQTHATTIVLIVGKKSVADVVSILSRHGCSDLTLAIDPSACSASPVAGGGFCDVYRGVTRGGTRIAIKCLRVFDIPGKETEKQKIVKASYAARELYHWSRLKHRNVLPLMGLAMFQGWISMISGWMDNGCLLEYIDANPDVSRMDLCKGICAGLSYIHAHEMTHGDLKAANVMVSPNGIALIADFGNAQLKDLTLRFTNATNTSLSVRWAAPEVLNKEGGPHASKKADVYAYGMTVLETLTGKPPYDGLSERRVLVLVAVQRKIPERPATGVSEGIWELLKYCWTWDQANRPDITLVENHLQTLCERLVPQTATANEFDGISSEDDLRKANLEKLQNMIYLVATYKVEGRLIEAELLEAKVLAIQKEVLGSRHPDTLESMASLARSYKEEGRIAEAESLQVEALSIQKQVLGDRHPDTLTSMANLASTYYSQGQLAEAEALEVRVLAIQKQVLGDRHLDTLTSMVNLASTYCSQGRLAEAELLEVKVLAIRKQVLGDRHPDTLESMANLVITYKEQGRLADAERLGVEVLAIRKQVLGDHHPDTLTSMTNLASTYYSEGRLADAEKLDVEALAIRKEVLGDRHPDTLTSMANLASVYNKQGRLSGAESLRVEVLAIQKQVLGDRHPDTLTSMANLASTYYSQGRLAEAESLGIEVLAIQRQVLGERNPDTLASVARLAITYRAQRRLAEAESLHVEVLAIRKQVLGDRHPDTLTSMANLAIILKEQGRIAEAESLQVEALSIQKQSARRPPLWHTQEYGEPGFNVQ